MIQIPNMVPKIHMVSLNISLARRTHTHTHTHTDVIPCESQEALYPPLSPRKGGLCIQATGPWLSGQGDPEAMMSPREEKELGLFSSPGRCLELGDSSVLSTHNVSMLCDPGSLESCRWLTPSPHSFCSSTGKATNCLLDLKEGKFEGPILQFCRNRKTDSNQE